MVRLFDVLLKLATLAATAGSVRVYWPEMTEELVG